MSKDEEVYSFLLNSIEEGYQLTKDDFDFMRDYEDERDIPDDEMTPYDINEEVYDED